MAKKTFKIWEQASSEEFPERFRGEYCAESFDDAIKQMLRAKPALMDLYRKENGKHFLDKYQLFQTKEEAKLIPIS